MEKPVEDFVTGHVIICGLGHVGHRCLCLLDRLGEKCIVITREVSSEWRQAAEAHFPILIGDARSESLLRQAGIEQAKSIIIVTNDDLANVSIALDARRLNAEISIVIRMFDQELAAHLEKSIKINRALSASSLAAPEIVAAALGDTVRGIFEVDSSSYVIQDCVIESDSPMIGQTVDQWARDTGNAIIALHRGSKTIPKPPPAMSMLLGDRVTFLSCAACHKKLIAKRIGISRMQAITAGFREWWRGVPVAFRIALVSLLAIVVLSVGIFHWALALSPVDSLYFVITTITTTGYGDISLKDAPIAAKLYGIFLMLCGAAIIAMLFSIVTDLILQLRFRDVMSLGSSHFKGHVIVAGLGSVGFRLVRELVHNGQSVVAIESKENGQFVSAARELASVVIGNAKMEETLSKAGVTGAKAVIAATDDDLANMSIGFGARRANNSCRVVLRLFDSDLAEKMHRGLQFDSVLSVSAAAAPTFVGSVLCPDVIEGIVLHDYLILIFNTKIQTSSLSTIGNEAVLFVKQAGQDRYKNMPTDYIPMPGDDIIGVRPYRLQNGRCNR